MKFRHGLVVGKFAPLHLGHVRLVTQALAACETLTVLSYSKPELPGCEPERRQRWLEQAFPNANCQVVTDSWLAAHELSGTAHDMRVPDNTAPDDEQRAFAGMVCQRLLGVHIDAVFTSEDYGPGFAAALAQRYGSRVAHVSVDRARVHVPISATRIRADVHALRAFLPDHVYADFVERIALLGGESSGKSTLSLALAQHFGTSHAPELGRELWEERGGALVYEDMLHIAERQIARERQACEHAQRYVFCDTTPLTTLFYCRELFGHAPAQLEALAERSYRLHVLCAPDFTFVQDGTRRDAEFRARQHAFYADWLARAGYPHLLAHGNLTMRVSQVTQHLDAAPY